MNVIILGAGRIGRGFVTQIMLLNGVKITYFDAMEEIVEKLNAVQEYTIHVLGHSELDIVHKGYQAYSIENIEQLAKEWEKADFIFTAVGGKNMKSVGKTIAKAFKKLISNNGVHISNIMTCENWVDPAKDLKNSILEDLTDLEKQIFEKNIGVGENVILCTGTGSPDPSQVTNEMDTWIQNFPYLPMEKEAIKGELPHWNYVDFVEHFGNLLTQKLYTNNTSCGSVAYLGTLLGKKYMAEASNDPVIEPIMDKVYDEINKALINGLGIDQESQFAFSKRAKEKYQDRDIVDLLSRIARDPLRKLRPNDRLIGPSKIALSVGVKPKAIALCTAAALFYYNSDDEASIQLKEMREKKGIRYILENVCELKPQEELYQMILDSVKDLQDRNWLKEEVKW